MDGSCMPDVTTAPRGRCRAARIRGEGLHSRCIAPRLGHSSGIPGSERRVLLHRQAVALAWTAHPARRRPRDLALVAAALFLTSGAVLVSFESLFMTGLAVVIVLLSITSFLFPTHYRLSDEGVEERRLGMRRARRWGELRRLEIGPGAALVSPFARKSWLDRTRGFLLLFDGADRQVVVDELRRRMEGAGRAG